MSLSELIEDSATENDKSSGSSEWLSGAIDSISSTSDKQEVNSSSRADVCPVCLSDNTEQVAYYWRCNNTEDCDVVTYIPNNNETDN